MIEFDEINQAPVKILPDNRAIHLYRQIYNWKLTISENKNSYCYDDGWEYLDEISANIAFLEWNGEGEPEGWHRNHKTGRRRPDGDPNKEFIRY